MYFILKSANISKCLPNLFKSTIYGNSARNLCVLGIETSCDDTGIAIVECSGVGDGGGGRVLANVLDSQQKFHTRYGGIIPPRAQDLHREKIAGVFERCMQEANMQPQQLDAIAVTNRPGLPLSLLVGLRYAKHLARKYHKPLVPVHHMEAHALQARMEHPIAYPFLCLLISGGHAQLAFVRAAGDFALLGDSLDDAPGEAFDKIARRLRLYVVPKYSEWNGGRAVEDAAREATNPGAFEFPLPLARNRNCNFSFAGIKNNSFRAIHAQERKEGTPPDGIISNYRDFCAGLLQATSRHLMHRTQRALEYCIGRDFFTIDGVPRPRALVVSGGVANNDYIFADIAHLAQHYDCHAYRPSKRYCSDNGVMIAWNGIEQIAAAGSCLRWDYDAINIQGKVQLGSALQQDVEAAAIKCKWVQAASWR